MTIESEEAMLQLGGHLSQGCQSGDIITLQGNLGAGKTTLVRGFLRGLGYSGKVKSPTYTLIESYSCRYAVNHFDLYRLSDLDELEMIGFRDYLMSPGISLIEWPECHPGLIDEASIRISIDYLKQGRAVTIQSVHELPAL